MTYVCDQHPDRAGDMLVTTLGEFNQVSCCNECFPLFIVETARAMGFTVYAPGEEPAPAPAAEPEAPPAKPRRRKSTATKDTEPAAGESTQLVHIPDCVAHAVDACTNAGVRREDLIDGSDLDAAPPYVCTPCYEFIKDVLPGQQEIEHEAMRTAGDS